MSLQNLHIYQVRHGKAAVYRVRAGAIVPTLTSQMSSIGIETYGYRVQVYEAATCTACCHLLIPGNR